MGVVMGVAEGRIKIQTVVYLYIILDNASILSTKNVKMYQPTT